MIREPDVLARLLSAMGSKLVQNGHDKSLFDIKWWARAKFVCIFPVRKARGKPEVFLDAAFKLDHSGGRGKDI